MICALTVRTLQPGTFEEFREAFMEPVAGGDLPEGWRHFTMIRGTENPDEVVCFGLFDGSVEELRAQDRALYEAQQARIAPYVAAVGADAFYDVVEDHVLESA
jgi:heme-degrading monooxygenase HmoA